MKILALISICLMSIQVAHADDIESIIIKNTSGWAVRIVPDGSAVAFKPADLDLVTPRLSEGTFSFHTLLRKLESRDSAKQSPAHLYSVALTSEGCEIRYYDTDQQDTCHIVFKDAIRSLAKSSFGAASLFCSEVIKTHKNAEQDAATNP